MASTPKIKTEFKPTKAVKERKEWRDPEGTILRRTVKQRDRFGKLKEVEQIFARVRYTDNEGKRREKKRLVNSASEAVTMRRALKLEIELELNPPPPTEDKKIKTFSQLLDFFEDEFVKEAVFSNDAKIEGYKEDLNFIRRHIELFRNEFGEKLVEEISYDDIRKFKIKRLAAPVVVEYNEKIELTKAERDLLPPKSRKKFRIEKKKKVTPRKFASVHRELARLRRIFTIAVRQKLIAQNPFSQGESLIQNALEVERLRIASFDEEKRLLAACTGQRTHLRTIILFAIDTAMRKSEIFRLLWRDVHFDTRRFFVQATNTKTGKSRFVPMTTRLKTLLEALYKSDVEQFGDAVGEERVFGIETNADNAWDGAREKCGIEDLHFHDLRATAITRMLRADMSEAEVMKISGHTQYKTFLKYVRQDAAGAGSAADKMDAFLDSHS